MLKLFFKTLFSQKIALLDLAGLTIFLYILMYATNTVMQAEHVIGAVIGLFVIRTIKEVIKFLQQIS